MKRILHMPFSINQKIKVEYLNYLVLLTFVFFSKNIDNSLHIIYAIFGLTFFFKRFSNPLRIISPLSLLYLYTSISFSIGSWAFSNDLVLNTSDLLSFKYFHNTKSTTLYIMICLIIIDVIESKLGGANMFKKCSERTYDTINFKWQEVLFISGIALFLMFLKPDLGFLGYSGSLNYFFICIVVLMLLIKISKKKLSIRIFGYVLIFTSLSFVLYASKRELIFFIFPILFLEARNINKINFKTIVASIFTTILLLLSIIVMSLLRGYGGFIPNSNPFEVIKTIPRYISSENFLKYLFNNLEVNYTFFHTYQAFEYIYQKPEYLLWGESFIKPLFIFLPRSIFPIKPQSIIHRYTEIYSPLYRDKGGSFPINLIAESFFNFHLLGLIIFSLLVISIPKVLKLILSIENKHVRMTYMFVYMNLIMLYRGSGIDLYLTYIILFIIFYSISTIPYYVLKNYYNFSK